MFFTMRRTHFFIAAASGIGLIVLFWCLSLWQPERQLLKHHQHFLQSIENRKWSKIERLLDPDYSDRWGYTRADFLRESREVFRQFIALTLHEELVQTDLSAGTGTVTTRIRVEGTGSALAMLARDEANSLTTPFVFEWKKRSWKPWDWKLVRIDNQTLHFERPSGF